MWLIERFLPARFEVEEEHGVFRVRVHGAGVLSLYGKQSP